MRPVSRTPTPSSPAPLSLTCARNARARAFLARYTRCNMCLVEGTNVHVRSLAGVDELGKFPKPPLREAMAASLAEWRSATARPDSRCLAGVIRDHLGPGWGGNRQGPV